MAQKGIEAILYPKQQRQPLPSLLKINPSSMLWWCIHKFLYIVVNEVWAKCGQTPLAQPSLFPGC